MLLENSFQKTLRTKTRVININIYIDSSQGLRMKIKMSI
jgi:hypothetical protein